MQTFLHFLLKRLILLGKAKVLLFMMLTALLSLNSEAQVTSTFLKQYRGSLESSGTWLNERLQLRLQTNDGGFLIAGPSNSLPGFTKTAQNFGGSDYWIIKTDASYNPVWDKTFGGTRDDELSRIIKTNDGGYLLTGYSYSPASGNKTALFKSSNSYDRDIWVVKITADGTKVWDMSYGGNRNDQGAGVIETPDGGFLLVGTSNSSKSWDKSQDPYSQSDIWLFKINKDGIKQWDKIFGGADGYDYASQIFQARDGNYLIGGGSNSKAGNDKSEDGFGEIDYWIIKITPDGTKIWDKTFGGNSEDFGALIEANPLGGYKITGDSYSSVSGNKTSESGNGHDHVWWFTLTEEGEKINENIYDHPEQTFFSLSSWFSDKDGYYHQYTGTLGEPGPWASLVIYYDWTGKQIWEWSMVGDYENYISGGGILKTKEGKVLVGISEFKEGLKLYQLHPGGVIITRIEAENYNGHVDIGTHPIVKVKDPGFSNGSSAGIYDPGDKIKLQFTTTGDQIKIRAQVRSGAYSTTSNWARPTSFWPNGYKFYVDGVPTTLTGNTSTVSGKNTIYGGSYWGTMESSILTLPAGTHTFEIEANKFWAGVDYIEVESIGSSVSSPVEIADAKVEKKTVKAHPNPFKNTINIQLLDQPSGNLSYLLTDAYGNTIQRAEQIMDQKSISIDVANLALKPGLYVVKVKTSSGEKTVKVIKE